MKRAQYLIFILFVLYLINVTFDRIKGGERSILWSDGEGFYDYLPGLFIIKDYHKLPPGSIAPYFLGTSYPYNNSNGEFVNKFTCGVSYFEMPFFGIGYLISKIKGVDPASYFSPIYCKAIAFGGILITLLGLLILYKTLLNSGDVLKKNSAFWTILSVFFGTNLFHYATKEMGMSHVYSFFLFSLLIFILPKFFKKPNFLNSIAFGAIFGWIVLIRPTNFILILLVLLFNVYSKQDIIERMKFFKQHWMNIFPILFAGFVMVFPQLLYWKKMGGSWIFYSYADEGFKYWNKPKIMAVLFDVQNGLLLYSPMVILMLIGIFYGLKNKKFHSPAMLLIFILATYIFASWWAWWFGGAFGHRSYVEYYAILAIPLAGLIQKVFSSPKPIVRISFQFLLILLMVYSVRLSYLYSSIGGPWDGADWRWNWDKYEWIMSYFLKIF
ncbi:MAG: hypothetical protein ABJB16_05910 [Saprospiraceae bacterium]